MIRQTALLGFAALAAAVASSAAQAGGGVRLNFGGPLPSFVATPTPGYGSPRSAGYVTHPTHRTQKAARKAAAQHAARRAHEDNKPPARIVKAPAKATHQAAAQAPKAVKRTIHHTNVVKRDETVSPKTETSVASAPSAAKSLASTALPPSEPLTAKGPETVIAAVTAPTALQAETVISVPDETASETKPAQVAEASGPQDCKKFIPAVGVTVTVGCEK